MSILSIANLFPCMLPQVSLELSLSSQTSPNLEAVTAATRYNGIPVPFAEDSPLVEQHGPTALLVPIPIGDLSSCAIRACSVTRSQHVPLDQHCQSRVSLLASQSSQAHSARQPGNVISLSDDSGDFTTAMEGDWPVSVGRCSLAHAYWNTRFPA